MRSRICWAAGQMGQSTANKWSGVGDEPRLAKRAEPVPLVDNE
jgi:hypothetical protein